MRDIYSGGKLKEDTDKGAPHGKEIIHPGISRVKAPIKCYIPFVTLLVSSTFPSGPLFLSILYLLAPTFFQPWGFFTPSLPLVPFFKG